MSGASEDGIAILIACLSGLQYNKGNFRKTTRTSNNGTMHGFRVWLGCLATAQDKDSPTAPTGLWLARNEGRDRDSSPCKAHYSL